MVQADPSRNYYADLGVPQNADENEIRKAFRKLALEYHPDRNRGREAQFVAKFQLIQAAHEILSDSGLRAKYDQERKRYRTQNPPAHNPSTPRPRWPPPPRNAHTTTTPGGSYYRAPPPKPPPQRPPPPQHYHSTYANGADRFTSKNFRAPPTPQQPRSKAKDAEARNVFTAWQKMKQQPQSAGNDANNPNGTPFGRSNSTRTPSKKGFDPATPGADEGQARSSYRSTYERAVPSPPLNPDPLKHFKEQMEDSIPNVPFAEGNRVRTPYYSSASGERTSMFEGAGRSASVRNSPTHRTGASTDAGFFSDSGRKGQRNSYSAGSSKSFAFQHMYDSSSDEESEAEVFRSHNSSRQTGPVPQPPPPPPRKSTDAPFGAVPNSGAMPGSAPSNFKSKSEESINMKFSPSDWHGKFEGTPDYFTPNIQKGTSNKGRTSPTRGRPAQRAAPNQNPSSGVSQPPPVSPFAQPQMNPMPPPPPGPPPLNTQSTFPPGSASAPHSTVFTQEKWAETFKEPSWAFPQASAETSPRRGSATTTKRAKAASRKPSVATTGTSNAAQTEGSRPKYQAFAEDVTNGDDDAMDIDSDTPPMEKSKPSTTANDKTYKAGTPIKFGSSSRTAPSSPKENGSRRARAGTLPTGSATAPSSAREASSKSGLDGLTGLGNVAPFAAPVNGNGLSNIGDLGDSLPFKSKAASSHPTKPNTAQGLKYPAVPTAPPVPPVLDEASTSAFFRNMAQYVRSYRIYSRTLTDHFVAREAELETLDYHFVQQRGETTKKPGFASYMSKMKEDEGALETWKIAQEMHLQAMAKCEEVRNKTLKSYAFGEN